MMGKKKRRWWLLPLAIVLLPFVIVAAAVWSAGAIYLLLIVWTTWCPRGKYALVVYSDSPVWREDFETSVLPVIGHRAAVLNWSDRKRWKFSLPVVLFRMFGGTREFNPIAIVFQPLTWPRRFRFYRAFRAFKQGHPKEVEQIRNEVVGLLDQLAPPRRPDE